MLKDSEFQPQYFLTLKYIITETPLYQKALIMNF
jgi:hypothetical protein